MLGRALFGALGLAASVGVGAQDYYDRGEEGWFWYNEQALAEEEEEDEEQKEQTPPPAPEERDEVAEAPAPPPSDEKGPEALSAAWYEENLESYLHKAIDDPTPENVEAYYRLQQIGLEKSQRFAEVARQVVTNNPDLGNFSARPSSGAGTQALERTARENTEAVTEDIWEEVGIAYFYQEDCRLCDQQASILAELQERSGVTIMAVSLDGSPISPLLAENTAVRDQGQAEMLEIEGTPALYLLRPPEEWVPISDGMLDRNQIYARTVETAYTEGWIDEKTYDSTRTVERQRMAVDLPTSGEPLPDDSSALVEMLSNLE